MIITKDSNSFFDIQPEEAAPLTLSLVQNKAYELILGQFDEEIKQYPTVDHYARAVVNLTDNPQIQLSLVKEFFKNEQAISKQTYLIENWHKETAIIKKFREESEERIPNLKDNLSQITHSGEECLVNSGKNIEEHQKAVQNIVQNRQKNVEENIKEKKEKFKEAGVKKNALQSEHEKLLNQFKSLR